MAKNSIVVTKIAVGMIVNRNGGEHYVVHSIAGENRVLNGAKKTTKQSVALVYTGTGATFCFPVGELLPVEVAPVESEADETLTE